MSIQRNSFDDLIPKNNDQNSNNSPDSSNPFSDLMSSENGQKKGKYSNIFKLSPDQLKKALSDYSETKKNMPSYLGQIGTGLKEGYLTGANAVIGRDYKPSPDPEEKSLKEGRGIGNFLGRVGAGATAAIPVAMTGGAAGFPIAGAALGGAVGGYATTPGSVPGRVIGALEGAIPYGASKIPFGKIMNAAFTKLKPKELTKSLQKGHDVLEKESEKIFKNVGEELTKRGSNIIKVDNALIDKAAGFMGNTKAAKSLIEKARSGDFSALRKLQSDLGERAAKAKRSPLTSENDMGKEMMEVRKEVNDLIHSHVEKSGHKDLSADLRKARDIFHHMKELYYKIPAIRKMVEKGVREVPDEKSILRVLGKDSEKMKRLRDFHPEIQEQLDLAKDKADLLPLLKKLGWASGIGGSAGLGGALAAYLSGKSSSGDHYIRNEEE
jgi:hypothetical protein